MRDSTTIYPDRDLSAEGTALKALAEHLEERVTEDPDNIATRDAFACELRDTPRRSDESEAAHHKRTKKVIRGFRTARYATANAVKRIAAGRDVALVPGDFGLAILDADEGTVAELLEAHPPYAHWRSDGKTKGYHLAYERTPLLAGNEAWGPLHGASGDTRTDNGYIVAWSLAGFLEAVKARAATEPDARHSKFLPLALYASSAKVADTLDCDQCAGYIRARLDKRETEARKKGSAVACFDRRRSGRWPIEVADYLLGRIDPRLPYDDWFKVGAALYRTWGGTEEAFEAWRRWSQSDPEHLAETKTHKTDRGLADRWRDYEREADRDGPEGTWLLKRAGVGLYDAFSVAPPHIVPGTGNWRIVTRGESYLSFAAIMAELGHEMRYNVLADQIEYRAEGDQAAEWEHFANSGAQRIVQDINLGYRYLHVDDRVKPFNLTSKAGKTADIIGAAIHDRRVNPFVEYLESLPPHDPAATVEHPVTREPVRAGIDDLLRLVFGAPDNALTRWASRMLFLGTVQRNLDPGCVMSELPILRGPQGTNKSTFLSLVPPRGGDYFTDSLTFDMNEKEKTEAIQGKILVEVGELSGLFRAELERVKSFISRRNDNGIRKAFRRDPEKLPRRMILVGTSNSRQPLPDDPTGNRRFLVIDCPEWRFTTTRALEAWMDRHRDQFFAEALALWNGEPRTYANMPSELYAAQREANEEETREHPALDEIVSLEDAARDDGGDTFYTLNKLRGITRESGHAVKALIVARGWTNERDYIDVTEPVTVTNEEGETRTERRVAERKRVRGWRIPDHDPPEAPDQSDLPF